MACSRAITFHPLRRGDRATVAQVFAGLGERSRRFRFAGAKPRLAERELDRLADVDGRRHQAVVAIDPVDGPIGIARFVRDVEDADTAELAIEVVDAHQGCGVGRRLVQRLADAARAAGVQRLRADVLHDNEAGAAVVRSLGRPVQGRLSEPPLITLFVNL